MTTIRITVVITAERERQGSATMLITIPTKMLNYVDTATLSMDIPSLLKVAIEEFKNSTIGKI